MSQSLNLYQANHSKKILSSPAKQLAGLLLGLTAEVGRGIFTSKKFQSDSQYQEYIKARAKIAESVAYRMSCGEVNSKTLLQDLKAHAQKSLASSSDINQQKIYQDYIQFLDQKIESVEQDEIKKLKKFNETISREHQEIAEKTTEFCQKGDKNNKFFLMSIVMALTAIGVIDFFDYLDFSTDILSPMFDEKLSFGQGLGDVITHDNLGGIGDFADSIELDKFAESLSEIPIIGDINELLNTITDTEIFQGFLPPLDSLLHSPLAYIGIAGIYLLYRAGNVQFPQMEEEKKFFNDKNKKLEDLHRDFLQSLKFDPLNSRDDKAPLNKSFIEDMIKKRESTTTNLDMADFIVKNETLLLDDSPFDKDFKSKLKTYFDSEANIEKRKEFVFDYLSKSKDDKIKDDLLLMMSIYQDGSVVNESKKDEFTRISSLADTSEKQKKISELKQSISDKAREMMIKDFEISDQEISQCGGKKEAIENHLNEQYGLLMKKVVDYYNKYEVIYRKSIPNSSPSPMNNFLVGSSHIR
jgi:hypothetical protein